MPGSVFLAGENVELRTIEEEDYEKLRDWVNHYDVRRFIGIDQPTNLKQETEFVESELEKQSTTLVGICVDGELGEYTFSYLEKAFFEDSIGVLEPSDRFSDEFTDLSDDEIKDERQRFDNTGWELWNFDGETIEGRLFGGCFEVLDWQMAAEKYIPDQSELEGKVLVLETSEESPSETEVKRWLMSMGENGILQKFSAIVVGGPVRESLHGEEKTEEEKRKYNEDQKNRIKQEIERYCPETPVVFDMDFGHTDPKIPLQLGGEIIIKPEDEKIELN